MLSDWLSRATSPGGILAFILGIITSVVYYRLLKPWYCRRHGIKLPYQVRFQFSNIILIIGALSVVWTGVKYTDLATDVAQCQAEFNGAIVQSRKIASDNDALSVEQRTIVFRWMHDLVFPPWPINSWENDDPRRQHWGIERTIQADSAFRESIDRQNQLIASRPPLPDPTCGRR